MSSDSYQEASHPDELLPWFVNGRLSPQEQREVEDHINTCDRCQKEVGLLENMREQIQATPLDSPGELGLKRLLKEIKTEKEAKKGQKPIQPRIWPRTLAIAASLIIVVQAGLLIDAWFFSKPMVPLSGPQKEGIILQVSFVSTATEEDIRKELNAVDGTVIDGPGQLGIYRIRLNLQPMDQVGIEEAIALLRQHKTVIGHVARE